MLENSTADRHSTLVLCASDVKKYLTVERSIAAVETAFRLLGSGDAAPPVTVGLHVTGGGFHIKGGVLDLGRKYFVVKSNGNFPDNPSTRGLPTIQGLVILADASDGRVLAVVDSVELTAKRTAAATAVAARYLAQPNSTVAAICGCGFQAYYQIEAVRAVLPIEQLIAVDADAARAERFAAQVSSDLGIRCTPAALSDAARAEPNVWITCTTSTEFFLLPEHVRSGAFVAGVGVDSENKRELSPDLLAKSHVVADLVDQCRNIGDLHHALAAGVEPRSVQELGKIVAGKDATPDRESGIVVFDSTGIGLQDVAACAAMFEAASIARANGADVRVVDFAS